MALQRFAKGQKKKKKYQHFLIVSFPKFCLIFDLPSCLLNYSFLDYPFEYHTSLGLREGIEFYTSKALWVILILLTKLSQFYFHYLCHMYCLGFILEFRVCFNEVFLKFSMWKFPDSEVVRTLLFHCRGRGYDP